MNLSIIIPIGPKETLWAKTLKHLIFLNIQRKMENWEVILIGTTSCPKIISTLSNKYHIKIKWQYSKPGRALQINKGLALAEGHFYWILHADTNPDLQSWVQVKNLTQRNLHKRNKKLYFFHLKFAKDGPKQIWLNEYLANVRSRLFKIPFGDQGLLFSKDVYQQLGPFKTTLNHSEDHDYIWKAHHQSVELICLPGYLVTSARKYSEEGWLNVTSNHLWLTYKVAIPHFFKLVFKKAIAKGFSYD